jgi:hypothetical protein
MPLKPRMSRPTSLWRLAAKLLGIVGFLIWMSSLYLWYMYAETRPRVVDISRGRVYSLITHGRVVYLTRGERVRLDLLMGVGLGLGFSAIGIQLNLAKRKR